MTRKQSLLRIIVAAQLKQADVHLRAAMIAAGEADMSLVTNDIRDAEFCLDDALARVESVAKKSSKKNLTNARDGL
jgi:hypothetical protein